MTQTLDPLQVALPSPRRLPTGRDADAASPRSTVIEMAGSAVAAVALVWLCFSVAGITGPLGFVFCVVSAFVVIYGFVCWQQYGVLAMKDRLATVMIWTLALVAFIPLVAVILYVIIKGAAVVFAQFPHFFTADMTGPDGRSHR